MYGFFICDILLLKLYQLHFTFYNYITLPNKIHSKEYIPFLHYSFDSVVKHEKRMILYCSLKPFFLFIYNSFHFKYT